MSKIYDRNKKGYQPEMGSDGEENNWEDRNSADKVRFLGHDLRETLGYAVLRPEDLI